MKKFGLIIMICLCFCTIFSGCSGNVLAECEKHVSDQRQNYFKGETENFYVSFSSGFRESPYALDGKPNNMVEFGVVTVIFKKRQATQQLTYVVSIDNIDFSGNFETSPFDDSYAGDIGVLANDDSTIFVSISNGSSTETAKMECVSQKFNINSKKALEIAVNKLSDELKNVSKNKNYEIHIKIIADLAQKVPDVFWLVMFLGEDLSSASVLINPTTGDCEIKKM